MMKFQLLLGVLWIVVLIAPAIKAGEGSICLHHDDDDRDHESYMEAICEEFEYTFDQVTELMSDQYCPIERLQSLATSCPYAESVFGLWDLETDKSGIARALTLVAQIYQTEKDVCIEDFERIAKKCLDEKMRRRPMCKVHTKYRSIDGCGNNKKHHEWGASDIPYARLGCKNYEDGIYRMKKSVADGSDLPNPRLIVTDILTEATIPDVEDPIDLIEVLLYFAAAADVGYAIPKSRCATGAEIQCCTRDLKYTLPENLQSPDCIPIEIPTDDCFFEEGEIGCMNMVRSELGRTSHGVQTGEIRNHATSYLDLSMIYGNHEAETKSIRLWEDGKLRMDKRDTLPIDTRGNYLKQIQDIIEFPVFSIVPIAFAKFHNTIACELKKVNHRWEDEKLFQEARRINIAVYQLTVLFSAGDEPEGDEGGRRSLKTNHIGKGKGVFKGLRQVAPELEYSYEEDVNPATSVEFNTLMNAFLYYIDDNLVIDNFDETVTQILQSDTIGKFRSTVKQNFDGALKGAFDDVNTEDYSEEIYNKIDKNEDGFGIDLIALGIQQGRDHGVPSYQEMRSYCEMNVIYEEFADFAGTISEDNIALLEALYKSPEDVDLYVGGMMEMFGGVDEPTDPPVFECVLQQTLMSKILGDIYFPLNTESPYPFTEDQIDTLMSLVVGEVPPFLCAISEPARGYLCSGYNPLDLCAWEEDEHHHHHHNSD